MQNSKVFSHTILKIFLRFPLCTYNPSCLAPLSHRMTICPLDNEHAKYLSSKVLWLYGRRFLFRFLCKSVLKTLNLKRKCFMPSIKAAGHTVLRFILPQLDNFKTLCRGPLDNVPGQISGSDLFFKRIRLLKYFLLYFKLKNM